MRLWQQFTLNRKFCDCKFGLVWCFCQLSSRLRNNPHTQALVTLRILLAVILTTAVSAVGKRKKYCHQMSGQYFWWLQSFSCTCPRCMPTIVADELELTQMRHIQSRFSNIPFQALLAVMFNPGIPRQLGAHWPAKTSKTEQGNTRTFQHICVYLESHQHPEPECSLHNTSPPLYHARRKKTLDF